MEYASPRAARGIGRAPRPRRIGSPYPSPLRSRRVPVRFPHAIRNRFAADSSAFSNGAGRGSRLLPLAVRAQDAQPRSVAGRWYVGRNPAVVSPAWLSHGASYSATARPFLRTTFQMLKPVERENRANHPRIISHLGAARAPHFWNACLSLPAQQISARFRCACQEKSRSQKRRRAPHAKTRLHVPRNPPCNGQESPRLLFGWTGCSRICPCS